jgi:hypothetical protein
MVLMECLREALTWEKKFSQYVNTRNSFLTLNPNVLKPITNDFIMSLLFRSELLEDGRMLTFHQLAAIPPIGWTEHNRTTYANHILGWIDRIHEKHSQSELYSSSSAPVRK